jgi:hypothetical protein
VKTPIIFFNFGECEKITGANKKPYSQQFSYAGSIVICPEKFKTSFCAHSFCAL